MQWTVTKPTKIFADTFHGTMVELFCVFLLFGLQYIGFQYIFTQDPYISPLVSDIMTCGVLSPSEVIFQCFIPVWVWMLCSAVFLCVDRYFENKGIIGEMKLYNPGRKPLKNVPWHLVRLSIEQGYINATIGVLVSAFVWTPLTDRRGICAVDNQWFESYTWPDILVFIVVKLPLFAILSDAVFYSTHRVAHENRWLYTRVHKLHHVYVDNFAPCAIAAHPLEHLLSNLPAVEIPLLILRMPMGFCSIWYAMAMIHTCFSHCGYPATRGLSCVPHDFHHHFQNVHFGAGGYCDWLFGTRLSDIYPKKWDLFLVKNARFSGRKMGGFSPDHLRKAAIAAERKRMEMLQMSGSVMSGVNDMHRRRHSKGRNKNISLLEQSVSTI